MGSDKAIKADFKVCSRCGVTKTFREFYSKGTKLESACKACVLRSKAKRYKAKKATEVKRSIDLSKRIRDANIGEVVCRTISHSTDNSSNLASLLHEYVVSLLVDE